MAAEPVRMSESIAEISKALIAFHRQCPKIPKLSRNPFLKSKYADLSTILEVVQPILNECDLVVQQHPTANFGLTTIVSHSSGEWISSEYPMQPLEAIVEKASGDKPASKAITPQSIGTVITYQRRYALGAILALNIDDDNDGHVEPTASTAPAGPKKTAQELMAEAAAKVAGDSDGQPGSVVVSQRVETAGGETPAAAEAPSLADQPNVAFANGEAKAPDEESTPEQRDRLKDLFAGLDIDTDGQAVILRKRGLSSIRSLSYGQANEIIGKLEPLLMAKLSADADAVNEATSGGGADESGQMIGRNDGPSTAEQVTKIKASLVELEQTKPGSTADCVARLNGAGFAKFAELNFDQASRLQASIEAQSISDFFEGVLATASAG